MGFALTPGEAPLHFSRSKNVMHVEIQESYRYVTYNGAKALCVDNDYGIQVGKKASCIILNAPDFYQALNNHVEVMASIRRGKVVALTQPAVTTLMV
ncbi:MAG: amidohydrolase family protein [Bifidobacterium catenulatum]